MRNVIISVLEFKRDSTVLTVWNFCLQNHCQKIEIRSPILKRHLSDVSINQAVQEAPHFNKAKWHHHFQSVFFKYWMQWKIWNKSIPHHPQTKQGNSHKLTHPKSYPVRKRNIYCNVVLICIGINRSVLCAAWDFLHTTSSRLFTLQHNFTKSLRYKIYLKQLS